MILAVCFICFTLPNYASDTNVFKAQSSLQGAALVHGKIQFLSVSKSPALLLGTNATHSILAIAIAGLDCEPTGVRPDVRLVAYDPSASTNKIVTLVQFGDILPVYNGANSLIMQATGDGGDGVIMAHLQALIRLTYQPCTTNAQSKPVNVEIDPLGFVEPTGTNNPAGPLVADSGELEIITDTTNIFVTLSGNPSVVSADCQIALNEQSLSFGNVEVGATNTLSVQVRNNGGAACSVTNLAINGGSAFSLVLPPSLPLGLAAGGATNLTVAYSPLIAGSDSALLLVASTDPSNSLQFVALSGTGVVSAADCHLGLSTAQLNFDTVQLGTNGALTVNVSNSGGSTCSVDAVTLVPSNAFFTVLLPASLPLAIAPGTSLAVTVTFSPVDTNSAAATLEFGSVDPLNPTNLLLVSLSGTGTAATNSLTIIPNPADFGGVALGASGTLNLTISNTGVTNITIASLTITNLTTTNADFALLASAATPFDITPGGSTDVIVKFAPSTNGVLDGQLQIIETNSVGTNTVALTGFGVEPTANCSLTSSTADFSFGLVAIGKTNVLKAIIRDVGAVDCTILSNILTGSTDFTLVAPANTPFDLPSNAVFEVGVVYIPSTNGTVTGLVQIISSDESNTVISLPVSGTGGQIGLGVSTNVLNFGSIPVGTSNTLTVTLSNTNAVNLTVNAVSIASGNEFSLDRFAPTSPFIIAPGDSALVPVIFAASTIGPAAGTLRIDSDDPNSPAIISLTGTGLACNVSVSSANLPFGTVALGTTNTLTLTISNTGNTNCVVDLLDVLGSGDFTFSAPPVPFTIPPGTNVQVDVVYVPVNSQTIVILGGNVRGSGTPTIIGP